MSETKNDLGQPIGFPVVDWQAAGHPRGTTIKGHFCRLEPIDVERHTSDLFTAFDQDQDRANWTYLPYGPFASEAELRHWISSNCLGDDPCFFSVVDLETGKAVGMASYLRISPEVGVIEVGHIHFSPLMQRLPIATEAMYLMMRQVFDVLGYRRYEWKCDALNQRSCNAAVRLGFLFEGVFRQAVMYKQRNRDTAWYSIIDREWPLVRAAFDSWLSADNFSADGSQLQRLSDLMQPELSKFRES